MGALSPADGSLDPAVWGGGVTNGKFSWHSFLNHLEYGMASKEYFDKWELTGDVQILYNLRKNVIKGVRKADRQAPKVVISLLKELAMEKDRWVHVRIENKCRWPQ